MNINSPFSKLCVVLTAGVLLFAAFGAISLLNIVSEPESFSETPLEEVTSDNSPKNPPDRGTRPPTGSPRTVLMEDFTNWDCSYCAVAEPGVSEVYDVYGPDQLVMIAYHWDFPGDQDPFYLYNPIENDDRFDYYTIGGVPDVFFDGVIEESGGPPGGEEAKYNAYKAHVETRLAVSSPITITLEGYLNMMTMNGYVNISIQATDSLPAGTLVVRTAITEDNRYADQGLNGIVRHRNVMRDMLSEQLLPPLSIGQYYNFSRSFVIDWLYSLDNLQAVVFVQNDVDQEVLQAAQYDFIPQRVLVVDDDQSVNPLGREDNYQEVLTFLDFAFDSYVLNEVGSPTVSDLAGYEVILWAAANTSSNTLTAADQTAISTYLDGGYGSLFMNGQSIGADIGATAFYQNYLHSTFVTDDTNENEIEGIAGDSLSDPFSGGKLLISNDSPSEIAPIAPATTTFRYQSSKNPAAVKAEHDIDSRVVYFAFMYFEHTDTIDNKAMIMISVISWLTDMGHRIKLSPGMNLISIPAEQFDTSIDTVLDSISGQYDFVQWYNTSEDDWKHDHDSKPAALNDLTDIHHHMGFWLHVTTPGDTVFVYPGGDPWQNQIVHLYPGWNLVGYPSLNEYDRTAGLNNLVYGTDVECVQTYDASTQQWVDLGPSDNFELGKGYWIYSNAEQDWEVPL